jgi:hypothetical protein
VTILGFGHHDHRSLDWGIRLDQWQAPIGVVDMNAPLDIDIVCNAFDFGDCQQSDHETRSLAQWKANGDLDLFGNPEYISPAPEDTYPDEFRTPLIYTPFFVAETQSQWLGVDAYARCDTAIYINRSRNGGCIFPKADSILEMITWDPEYGQSASFIATAFENIQALHRPIEKYVPGNFDLEKGDPRRVPLTRKAYGIAKRTKIQMECRRLYGIDYTTNPSVCTKAPCDCDEYPFAGTQQNAESVTDAKAATYVVKPVNRHQNRSAGNRIINFLTNDHILDGDPFWISTTPDDD